MKSWTSVKASSKTVAAHRRPEQAGAGPHHEAPDPRPDRAEAEVRAAVDDVGRAEREADQLDDGPGTAGRTGVLPGHQGDVEHQQPDRRPRADRRRPRSRWHPPATRVSRSVATPYATAASAPATMARASSTRIDRVDGADGRAIIRAGDGRAMPWSCRRPVRGRRPELVEQAPEPPRQHGPIVAAVGIRGTVGRRRRRGTARAHRRPTPAPGRRRSPSRGPARTSRASPGGSIATTGRSRPIAS